MTKMSTFYSTLARELLDAVHFPACSLGASAATHTFALTLIATHTELAHHYILYVLRTLSIQEDFFKVPHGHIKALTLERVASHIKVTTVPSPCLFQLPPWENV